MIVVGVKILLRKEVLDVQGRAVAKTLKLKGHPAQDCLCGKFIKLTISAGSRQSALKKAREMAESVLCNLLVEEYELEVLSEGV